MEKSRHSPILLRRSSNTSPALTPQSLSSLSRLAGSNEAFDRGPALRPYNRAIFPGDRGVPVIQVSLFRLYSLRLCYLILAAGLGIFMWPSVLRHTPDVAIEQGIRLSLLAGLGLAAVLGLRYPVQMIPLLLFELIWKSIYLLAFAFPLWRSHAVNATAAADIQACLMVVVFIPLIPWGYVVRHYITRRGDPWRTGAAPSEITPIPQSIV